MRKTDINTNYYSLKTKKSLPSRMREVRAYKIFKVLLLESL